MHGVNVWSPPIPLCTGHRPAHPPILPHVAPLGTRLHGHTARAGARLPSATSSWLLGTPVPHAEGQAQTCPAQRQDGDTAAKFSAIWDSRAGWRGGAMVMARQSKGMRGAGVSLVSAPLAQPKPNSAPTVSRRWVFARHSFEVTLKRVPVGTAGLQTPCVLPAEQPDQPTLLLETELLHGKNDREPPKRPFVLLLNIDTEPGKPGPNVTKAADGRTLLKREPIFSER